MPPPYPTTSAATHHRTIVEPNYHFMTSAHDSNSYTLVKPKRSSILAHIAAVVCVTMWGLSFVSSSFLLDGDRMGVLRRITEEGEIIADLFTSFSAMDLTRPEIFPSLLFYYGMLTIKASYGSQLLLAIPNNNVRKQYYSYLLENYDSVCNVNHVPLRTGFTRMAFDGQWRETLQYMADCYRKLSSVRDSIEGERNIQGFFLAYLNLNDYYITAPELELQHGYCDFFLLPNLTHYKSEHSYIIEVKYLPKKDFESKSESQWEEAVQQIKGYAQAPRVEALRQGTTLHRIVMQFCGWDLARMEEV